jgi:hypothetical protein
LQQQWGPVLGQQSWYRVSSSSLPVTLAVPLDHSRLNCTKFSNSPFFIKKIPAQKSIVIYIFIADSFVNEIFGDNMITPFQTTAGRYGEPY